MKGEPLVSIIMIFFNGVRFMAEAIESVLAQTCVDWELLLVDDGSSDGSTAVAEDYVAQFPGQVYYLDHEGHRNKGMSASRNLGISRAKGRYVAFLDSDDVWLPLKLEQQTALMALHERAAMVYGRTLIWYGWTGRPEDQCRDHFYELGVLPDALIEPPTLFFLLLKNKVQSPTTCNAMMRRCVFEEFGGFEERFRGMYEDQVFFSKIQLRAPVFVAGECWAKYRQHPESFSLNAETIRDYYAARRPFLEWLNGYVRSKNIREKSIINALRGELRRSRHPRFFQWLMLPGVLFSRFQRFINAYG